MHVSARNVHVEINGRAILRGVDVDAPPGTMTALIGPNGAGKSTLLGALAGDTPLAQGTVRYDARDPYATAPRELSQLRAMMLQDVGVAFAFLVRDVVAMGRRPWARTGRAEFDEEVVDGALAATGMSHLQDRDIMTLSGGERARAALSRVLAQETPLALFDEPTAAMDIRYQEQTLGLLRSLADAGSTILVVLHDLNAAAAYCDRFVCLRDGVVAAAGGLGEVVRADVLSAVYDWPIEVAETSHGVQVLPARAQNFPQNSQNLQG